MIGRAVILLLGCARTVVIDCQSVVISIVIGMMCYLLYFCKKTNCTVFTKSRISLLQYSRTSPSCLHHLSSKSLSGHGSNSLIFAPKYVSTFIPASPPPPSPFLHFVLISPQHFTCFHILHSPVETKRLVHPRFVHQSDLWLTLSTANFNNLRTRSYLFLTVGKNSFVSFYF